MIVVQSFGARYVVNLQGLAAFILNSLLVFARSAAPCSRALLGRTFEGATLVLEDIWWLTSRPLFHAMLFISVITSCLETVLTKI